MSALEQGSPALLPPLALPQCQLSPSQPLETPAPGKVWGARDNMLELGEVDGAVLVNVGLLQDLWGKVSTELSAWGRAAPVPWPMPSRFG